jgi:hypothetical protein
MLYGLWAAALPILIHLLNRRRSVTVSFSNVALLQTLQHDRMRRVKLKQWSLLVIRTVLVALLVLAFARPTVREVSFGSGQGETSAVLLLDQSLSMRARSAGSTLFEHAKKRAGKALALFVERDEVTLLPFDDRVSPPDPLTLDRVRLVLASVEATYRGSNPVPAIDAARRQLRESDALNRELFVFSDLARVGWESVREPYDGFEGTTVFVVRSPGADVSNVAIRSIRPAGLLLAVGEPAHIVAELENFGPRRVTDLPVNVFVDHQRIGQKMIQIGAGERKRVSFRYTPEKGGAREFRVEIPDDGLTEDNTRSSIVHIPDRLRIGLVGEADARYYVQEALNSGGGTAFEISAIEPGSAGSEVYQTFDLLVLCSVRRLNRGEINAIRRSVSRGAGLLILLGEGVDIRLYNEQILPALCPLSITGVSGRRSQRVHFTAFDPTAADHPTLLGLVDSDLKSPRFYLNYTVRTESETRVLLNFTSGSPAFVESRLGQGRVMTLMSHADLEWSDLPVTGFFAPFLHRAVRYLSTGVFGTDDVPIGRRVVRAVTDLGARDAVVQPPEGPVQTVWAQQLGDRSYWVIDEVGLPGVWEIYSNERVVDRFAAQVSSEEGDLRPVSDEAITGIFPGAHVVFVEPDEALDAVVARYRHGAELWRYFLFAALAFLAIELMLMSGETRERV